MGFKRIILYVWLLSISIVASVPICRGEALPSPYALPWQLRPVLAKSLARLDSAQAFYSDANGNSGGFATATTALGSYAIRPDLAVLARFGFVANSAPMSGSLGASFTNPLLAGLYALEITSWLRAAFFLGVTVPVGTGGGDSPDLGSATANAAGIHARSAMDNALFAVNYLTLIPGASIAFVSHNWTAQLEATLLQLTRVRGYKVDRDPARTNFTAGLEVGYAFHPIFLLQAELRYQRWIENPTVFAAPTPSPENFSFAAGPRFTFDVNGVILRPGIAYAQGLVGPVSRDRIVFVDLPILF